MPHIVVVGSLNMDLVVRTHHMPGPGETVLGDDFQTIPGGKGANQAVAAARQGARVSMVGRVGDDAFGQTLRSSLQAEGIDISHVKVASTAPTGIAMITLDEAGQNSIVVAPGANAQLTAEDVETALNDAGAFDALVMQLETSLPAVQAAARMAHEHGAKIILNPAPAQPVPAELLTLVDVLIPNESETSMLSGLPADSPEQAKEVAQVLLDQGVGAVVLTLGAHGAVVLEPGQEVVHLPPYLVDVVDTTAAGDAFVAALATRWSEGVSLWEAAYCGNKAGALAVTKLGAQPSLPTRAELEQLC